MTVVLDGRSLTIEDAVAVAHGAKVRLDRDSLARMARFRALLDRKLDNGEVVYGVNTGFGSLSNRSVGKSEIKKLQVNLVRSHAAGVGKHMPEDVVKVAMLVRLNSLLSGNSAVGPEIAEFIVELLNRGVVPHVPEFGSLGASGDLVPSAHMALTMIGEGKAEYKGSCVPASRALASVGLKPIDLHAKSGLSLVNGTCFTTSFGCVTVASGKALLHAANLAVALTAEAVGACSQAFDPRLMEMKRDKGQGAVAKEILILLRGSERLRMSPIPQDPYSIRCAPQVHGALHDAVEFAERLTVAEMNSVSDNPVLLEDGSVLHGGNFHAQPVAMGLDLMALALSYLGVMSLARTGVLLSKAPAERKYMTKKPGLESGLMILQYTATALAAENSKEITPVSAYPADVSEGIEDHASHGVNAGLKASAVARNISRMLAIELICASNALGEDVSGVSKRGAAALREVRKVSPLLKGDRSMSDEIEELASAVASGRVA